MTHDLDERCRQVETLLAYGKVGPLSAGAIAVNLGATESLVQDALEALLYQSRVVPVGIDAFTIAPRRPGRDVPYRPRLPR